MIQNWTDEKGVVWAQKATIGDGMTGPPGIRYHGKPYKVLDPNFTHKKLLKSEMDPDTLRLYEACERVAQGAILVIAAAIIYLLLCAL